MKPNEQLYVEITNTAPDGRGIAHAPDGRVIFTEGAVTGDCAKIQIYTVHKTYATAGIVKLEKASVHRNGQPCVYSERCGGCPLSHIRYDYQLQMKKQTVIDALERLGKVDLSNVCISDTLGMEHPYAYRNKMVFPVGEENGKAVGGFYEKRSHRLVPLTTCSAGEDVCTAVLQGVLSFMNDNGISAYNEQTHRGIIRRVFVRTAYHTKEMMIVISSAMEKIPFADRLVALLTAQNYGEYRCVSIIQNIHKRPDNRVLGNKNMTLWGSDFIEDTIFDLRFHISPHSFFQVNPIQTEVLYKTAVSFAEISPDDTVLDIYCGIGTISLAVAQFAKKVIGVEIVDRAIEDAKENATENGLTNAQFYCGAAEEIVPKLLENHERINTVILDPPRKGSDEKTLSAIVGAAPARVVYVSCNPATLARDVRYLAEQGYTLTHVVPVDMFPHTEHVETVVRLVKKV